MRYSFCFLFWGKGGFVTSTVIWAFVTGVSVSGSALRWSGRYWFTENSKNFSFAFPGGPSRHPWQHPWARPWLSCCRPVVIINLFTNSIIDLVSEVEIVWCCMWQISHLQDCYGNRQKTLPQAKRHKPSPLFTSLTILTSLTLSLESFIKITFITR